MTIEVRQILIKSTVGTDIASSTHATASRNAQDVEQWKEEVLAECKAWFEEKLNELRER
jgi:Family of unknown function (DUF5908)